MTTVPAFRRTDRQNHRNLSSVGIHQDRDCSEGWRGNWLLANGLLMSVDKAPVANKPKAMTVTPIVRFMGVLLSW
jgi:hypothetical protein